MGHVGMGEMGHSDRSGIEENVEVAVKNLVSSSRPLWKGRTEIGVVNEITMGRREEWARTAHNCSAIQERIECFHVFGHGGSRPYQSLGMQRAIAPNKHQLKAYSSGKLPTSRCPLFLIICESSSTRQLLKLVCEAKL